MSLLYQYLSDAREAKLSDFSSLLVLQLVFNLKPAGINHFEAGGHKD